MSAGSDASAHSVASLALEAYRTRIGAVINYVDDAAAARIPLPTDEAELEKTVYGLLDYLLAAEDAFKASRALLTEHAGRLERVAAARAALRAEQAQTAALVAELLELRDAADDEIAAEMNRADELRAAAAAGESAGRGAWKPLCRDTSMRLSSPCLPPTALLLLRAAPVRLTDLIEAAERYAYTTPVESGGGSGVGGAEEAGASAKAPVLPPMPGEPQMRASLTFQMQGESSSAAAYRCSSAGAPYHHHGICSAVIVAHAAAAAAGGRPLDAVPVPDGFPLPVPPELPGADGSHDPLASRPLPGTAWLDPFAWMRRERAGGDAAVVSSTTVVADGAAAESDHHDDVAMARAAAPAASPPPPHLHVPPEGMAAAVATPVPQQIPVTMPIAPAAPAATAAPATAASGGVSGAAAGVPSTAPSAAATSAAAGGSGAAAAAAAAAPKRVVPAAAGGGGGGGGAGGGGINLSSLPPELQALIRSRFPKDWRPGDPLPPNLPPIKQLLASLQRKPA